MNKACFLDRDGILNNAIVAKGKPFAPRNEKDFKIKKNFLHVAKHLKLLNYLLKIKTNQPDVKKKLIKKKTVNKFNKELKKFFNLDDVFVCYSNNNNYFRRKPNPGMIIEAQKKWKIDLKKSYLIGDRKKDIDAGLKVGLKTIFLDENYKEPKPINYHFKIKNLSSIKKIILE